MILPEIIREMKGPKTGKMVGAGGGGLSVGETIMVITLFPAKPNVHTGYTISWTK